MTDPASADPPTDPLAAHAAARASLLATRATLEAERARVRAQIAELEAPLRARLAQIEQALASFVEPLLDPDDAANHRPRPAAAQTVGSAVRAALAGRPSRQALDAAEVIARVRAARVAQTTPSAVYGQLSLLVESGRLARVGARGAYRYYDPGATDLVPADAPAATAG